MQLLKWLSNHRAAVVIMMALTSYGAFQTEGVASGEFVLTDRIGTGSVFRLTESIHTDLDGKTLYFQDGRPVRLTELKTEHPYCKFTTSAAHGTVAQQFYASSKLEVQFKNVARARWFFDHGIELECRPPQNAELHHGSITETDFENALGKYFQVEKHTAV